MKLEDFLDEQEANSREWDCDRCNGNGMTHSDAHFGESCSRCGGSGIEPEYDWKDRGQNPYLLSGSDLDDAVEARNA